MASGVRVRYMAGMVQPSKRANRRLLALMVAMMAVVAVGIVTLWYVVENGPRDPGYATAATPSIGGPFSLIDQTGQPVTDKTYAGRYQLIYFGYTFCPDACPTELQIMAQAIETLGPNGGKVQPIFITIDPARDTPKQLANYVPQFDKRLVGLTGSPQQIADVAREFKVYYAKADDTPAYAMNHSSFVYLMNPEGRFLTVFPSDMDGDKMASEILTYMKPS
jgi:protein SCO1/2